MPFVLILLHHRQEQVNHGPPKSCNPSIGFQCGHRIRPVDQLVRSFCFRLNFLFFNFFVRTRNVTKGTSARQLFTHFPVIKGDPAVSDDYCNYYFTIFFSDDVVAIFAAVRLHRPISCCNGENNKKKTEIKAGDKERKHDSKGCGSHFQPEMTLFLPAGSQWPQPELQFISSSERQGYEPEFTRQWPVSAEGNKSR